MGKKQDELNAELIKQIQSLSPDTKPEDLEGVGTDDLKKILAELEEADKEKKQKLAEEAEKLEAGFYVVDGRAVSFRQKVYSKDTDPRLPEDVPSQVMERWIKKGLVKKVK